MTKKKSEDVVRELAKDEALESLSDLGKAELAKTGKMPTTNMIAPESVEAPFMRAMDKPSKVEEKPDYRDALKSIQHMLTEDGSFELGRAAACIGEALVWCERHETTDEP